MVRQTFCMRLMMLMRLMRLVGRIIRGIPDGPETTFSAVLREHMALGGVVLMHTAGIHR